MGEEGLGEVANPSSLFLTDRSRDVPGSVVFPALEGTRPVLVEVQALTVRLASGATPWRAVVGCDCGRVAMGLSGLEARFRPQRGDGGGERNQVGRREGGSKRSRAGEIDDGGG